MKFFVDFAAPAEGYMSARAGEIVMILNEEDPEWYYGMIDDERQAMGWFPRASVVDLAHG
jgi:hypothetical protein